MPKPSDAFALPRELEHPIQRDILVLERRLDMPYISSPARFHRDEGLMEGRKEGQVAGRIEGQALTLLEQLQHRFGRVPRAVRARIADANAAQLRAWAVAVLDPPTLEGVFDER